MSSAAWGDVQRTQYVWAGANIPEVGNNKKAGELQVVEEVELADGEGDDRAQMGAVTKAQVVGGALGECPSPPANVECHGITIPFVSGQTWHYVDSGPPYVEITVFLDVGFWNLEVVQGESMWMGVKRYGHDPRGRYYAVDPWTGTDDVVTY